MKINPMVLPLLPISILLTAATTFLLNSVFTTTHFGGYNGINPLYSLTNLCFKLHHWGVISITVLYILIREPGDTGRVKLKEVGLVTILASLLLTTKSCLGFEKVRLVSVNIGLSNILGQYHPPILFIYQTVVFVWILSSFTGKRPNQLLKRPAIPITGLLAITALMSAWWADQELFWGSFWNWDPVEVASIFILLGSIVANHTLTYGMVDKNAINPLVVRGTACALIVYLITRGPLANSVHMFTNSFLMRIDKPLYVVFISIPVIYFLALTYSIVHTTPSPEQTIRTSSKGIRAVVYKASVMVASSLLLLLVSTTNKVLGLSDKDFFKLLLIYLVITTCVLSPLKPQTLKVRMGYDFVHLPIICTIPVLLVVWESPHNQLYTAESPWAGIQVQYMSTSANIVGHTPTNHYHIFQNKLKLLSTKHDTRLDYQNMHWSRLDTYSRPNNNVLFFGINTRAVTITAVLWLFIKPKATGDRGTI